ncbi:YHYH domain-containing protein [Microbulbifer salipaludis]|uniref:YHYH domain-containing protein n=1 Tax=Microbulbifer salipaludis TaxID=187980 RepID=A0ABS3E7K7_9GAMM|nr:YHYH domain-containing protein [Microbulbifer salipaludis]
MKAKFFILLSILVLSGPAFSHSGNTDSNGGHNCSEKSKKKGLCSGYHYHRNSVTSAEFETPKPHHSKTDTKLKQSASSPITAS